MQDNTYHAAPDETFHAAKPDPLPADFSFNDSTPPPEADFTGAGGRFRKGSDPRRHVHNATCGHALYQFTAADRSAGFWAGLAAYVEAGGEARNFLRRKMGARGQSFRPTPKAQRGWMSA